MANRRLRPPEVAMALRALAELTGIGESKAIEYRLTADPQAPSGVAVTVEYRAHGPITAGGLVPTGETTIQV